MSDEEQIHTLGYIHYHDNKLVREIGMPRFYFKQTDRDKMRQGMLSLVGRSAGCHVYRKTGDTWILVPTKFLHLRDTWPYWNLPMVVIVEYTFSK